MAVTDTEHKTEHRSSEDEEAQDSARHDDGTAPEESGNPQTEGSKRAEPEGSRPEQAGESESAEHAGDSESSEAEGSESGEAEKAEKKEKKEHKKGIAGGVGIFLILAIYFVWIGSEMGSHAISGTFEMWAIFGAIFFGVLALVAGGAISRKRND